MQDDIVDFAKQIVNHTSLNIRVCMPAKIESYDHKTQKASVKIDMKESYADGTTADYPVVSGVPVIFMASGGASITMPVKPNDTCLLVFADRDISGWLLGSSGQKPDSRRSHSLTDAVAFVGLNSFKKPSAATNNDDLLINYSGSSIRLKPNGIILIDSAEEVTIKTKEIIINCTNANITATETVNVNCADAVVTASGNIDASCENSNITVNNNLNLNVSGVTTATTPNFVITGKLEVQGSVELQSTVEVQGVITSNGISNTSGTITSSGKVFDTHTHKYLLDGVPTDTASPT